ncbi:hypothetical protein DM02DRAFT_634881 [Periconia macrospinosa]|uniref:Uncharacterized protein n=1 Tax=Periconia macrospinosa TaxID=97972 RepID=A0A2V1D678_9PLEO|nr:hypothetical protein DM02DRAFT_634881 [Periconia macrospinosa]
MSSFRANPWNPCKYTPAIRINSSRSHQTILIALLSTASFCLARLDNSVVKRQMNGLEIPKNSDSLQDIISHLNRFTVKRTNGRTHDAKAARVEASRMTGELKLRFEEQERKKAGRL